MTQIPYPLCVNIGVFNHISNSLIEKMVDDLEYKKKILKYHYQESIGIFICELNKVHNICIQFVGDKKKSNSSKSIEIFYKEQPYTPLYIQYIPFIVNVIPLYNNTINE